MAAELNVTRFYDRLCKLQSHFIKHRAGSGWGGASCISLTRGSIGNESDVFLKSIVLHQYLFGYELPETILLLKDKNVTIIATRKKCEFLEPAVKYIEEQNESPISLNIVTRSKTSDLEELFSKVLEEASIDKEDNIGMLTKEDKYSNSKITDQWNNLFENKVDVSGGLSLLMSVKDSNELDTLKKSSILSNKVLKHGVIPRIEEIIDSEIIVTHETLANEIDSMIEEPSKINLNIPKEQTQSCYYPIVQSGGQYDIKISAQSTANNMKYDIITVSFGARYQLYCSNVARTFLVDAPSKVSDTYELLLGMQQACLLVMIPGKPLKSVYSAAISFLKSSQKEELIKHLPKHLGFSIGIDFRDAFLLLNAKNPVIFRQGMVFSLSIGFANVELSAQEKSQTPSVSAVKELTEFGLLLTDTVGIHKESNEVLTKHSKELSDVSYTINSPSDEDIPKEKNEEIINYPSNSNRSSDRLKSGYASMQDLAESASQREKRQMEIITRRNESRVKELSRKSEPEVYEDVSKAKELTTYKSTSRYPDCSPNQVKVDMNTECVILPICGNPIPFHISTIKNVVCPDPDGTAHYLRLNFYAAGSAIGKDTPANMSKLITKYAHRASFIRELTFRSLSQHSLRQAYIQITSLRKTVRAREILLQEESNLVKQDLLRQTKMDRVPRLSDLTMRPVFAGRKTYGNLESHTNGLRFRSSRGELLDIMYNNIKHSIFQPCESEIMVLIHFHLKNPIMIGKKKHRDVQFFTEVIDASLQVDGKGRNLYDPDEVNDEQRERQLRKRLNEAFKDFCRKVESVSKKNGYTLEFDIPYRDLGFQGTPLKEMVMVQPTLNCLVNLTETPFFVVDLNDIDHAHFERVSFGSKNIDLVLINKNFTKPPYRVDMIPSTDKDSIQEWLTDMELSYTEGPMNLNWKQIIATVASDERFYMNTYEDEVTPKDAGWDFLRLYGKESDEGSSQGDDSAFSDAKSSSEEESGEQSDESDFDSSESEDSYDADKDLEEKGMDWDEMEEKAHSEERAKRNRPEDAPRKRKSYSSAPIKRRRK